MNKVLFTLLALATVLTGFSGCDRKPITSQEDQTPPTILMSSPPVNSTDNYYHLDNTSTLHIDLRFEDDKELDNYVITIRQNFLLNFLKTDNFGWSETFFGPLTGIVDGFNRSVDVPFDPSAGPYEFRVVCTDKAGKTSEIVSYLYLTNLEDTTKPRVEIFTPDPDTANMDTFLQGWIIPITGHIQDLSNNIEDIYMRVRNAATGMIMDSSEIRVDTLFNPNYPIDTFFTIRVGTPPGYYDVECYANDPVQNVGKASSRIYIQ